MKHLPRLFAVCLAALALLPAQEAAPTNAVQAREALEPVVVFLVRHAEKASDDSRDPELSDGGRARADELARVLAGAGATQLFATEYARTQHTLLPLAESTGLDVEVVGGRELDAQLERLLALEAGSVAVVAGHSNTVPAMARQLARTDRTPSGRDLTAYLGEDEYDVIFEVVLPPPGRRTGEGAALPKLLELRYGAPGR